MSSSTLLTYEQHGGVVILTLNDPTTRNALSGDEMFSAIEQAVDRIDGDPDVRVMILTGQGSVFCSGGNVKDMAAKRGMFGGSADRIVEQYRAGIQRVPRALMRLEVPSIAAVNGPAIGAGCDLACMCDIRIASERAVFAESFSTLGIVPGDGGAWLLIRAVGYARAAEMAFTGERLDARTAQEIGLVSRVVPPDALMSEALALANRIAANPPTAVRLTKRLLREASHTRFETMLEMSAAFQALAHASEDHLAAMTPLAEKPSGES